LAAALHEVAGVDPDIAFEIEMMGCRKGIFRIEVN